jgi:LacI family transcriptional regulator
MRTPVKPDAAVTVRDVARLAGVSLGTASAVINGVQTVSSERRERVLRAMQALDYRPNELSRSLKSKRSRTIGVVVPDITNPFYAEAFRAIASAAREHDITVILCDTNNDVSQEARQLDALHGRRVDGILIACTDSRSSYDSLSRRGVTAVFFELIPLAGSFMAVSTDHVEAGRLATRHFLELGHQRIAFLMTNRHLSTNRGRMEGFQTTMQAARLPIRPEYLRHDLRGSSDGYTKTLELLALPEPPTALFASSTAILLGVARALAEKGVNCPGEISLLGFDQIGLAENFIPPLTTVAQPVTRIAGDAFRLLMNSGDVRPSGDASGPAVELLQPCLRVRRSTREPRSRV